MPTRPAFAWPMRPSSDASFVALMNAIDQALSLEGLEPWQRPLHIGRKLWEAFGWAGNILPAKELASQPGFDGPVLMAKAHAWYEQTYGERLNSDWAYGYAPVRLGNALWRVRAGVSYGTVRLFIDRDLRNGGVRLGRRGAPARVNVLLDVDGLPQGLASNLTNDALRAHLDFHVFVHRNLQWRHSLPRTDLFAMAKADYDECTASVMGRRNNQARWASQQAVEKTIKGFLKLAGTPYPVGGPNGHNLDHIAELLEHYQGIAIQPALLRIAACSPKVRYGEEQATDEQALLANHAVLGVLEQLRANPNTAAILNTAASVTATGS